MQIEGVRQNDAVEGFISAFLTTAAMVGLLDVNGRNVIGEQDHLVGVKLAVVLPGEIGWFDESGLEQADQKGTRAGEGVEDVHAFITQTPAELLTQYMIRAVEDEVHDFLGV